MHRSLIVSRARNLMTLHGLGPYWNVELINATSKAGSCHKAYWDENPAMSSGTLKFSVQAFALMSDDDCDNVILHEIAHALCPTEYDKNGRRISHGDRWKRTARRIGCDAKRTTSIAGLAEQKPKNWRGTCREGHTIYRTRLTESTRTNSACATCVQKYNLPLGKRAGAKLSWVRNTGQPVVRSTPVPKTQTKPRPVKVGETAWKDRYDQGMTSFDDDW